jgi:hypothetical protein
MAKLKKIIWLVPLMTLGGLLLHTVLRLNSINENYMLWNNDFQWLVLMILSPLIMLTYRFLALRKSSFKEFLFNHRVNSLLLGFSLFAFIVALPQYYYIMNPDERMVVSNVIIIDKLSQDTGTGRFRTTRQYIKLDNGQSLPLWSLQSYDLISLNKVYNIVLLGKDGAVLKVIPLNDD